MIKLTKTNWRFLVRNLMDTACDAEARALRWWILSRLRMYGEMNASQIYMQSECGDQAMYLALHRLVKAKLISGFSPYDERCQDSTHRDWVYRLADRTGVNAISRVACVKAQSWDPNKWDVNTVCGSETVLPEHFSAPN